MENHLLYSLGPLPVQSHALWAFFSSICVSINDVLKDFLGIFVIAYIDDVLIYSLSYEQHVTHVCQVLAKLQENHLYVKGEKCEFNVLTTSSLGYIVSQDGVAIDWNKVQAVTDWSWPQSIKVV